ncbi:MAG: type II toxin-antitoxin system VapC family toxin [Spirochaetaceae bacterium]|nr:type II toxin-antitoxin system VapC family toxin [Spirochaetaceae bacterium]
MPKPKFVLDSTIAIDLLNGLPSSKPVRAKLENAKVYVSIVTRIEMLSFPNVTPEIERRINNFFKSVKVIPLNRKVEQNTIMLRRSKKLKIPDSIIAATALSLQAAIISRDDHFIRLNWPGLPVITG